MIKILKNKSSMISQSEQEHSAVVVLCSLWLWTLLLQSFYSQKWFFAVQNPPSKHKYKGILIYIQWSCLKMWVKAINDKMIQTIRLCCKEKKEQISFSIGIETYFVQKLFCRIELKWVGWAAGLDDSPLISSQRY